jgi:signal transduction histidine kinase/HAMP domain-containing protein
MIVSLRAKIALLTLINAVILMLATYFISNLVLAMVALIVFAGCLLAVGLEFHVVRRLKTLTQQIDVIGVSRNFARRINLAGTDEIGGLARSINKMLKELKTSQDELKEIKATLETRVAERTIELTNEKEFTEAILNNLPSALVLLESGKIVHVNQAFSSIFCSKSASPIKESLADYIDNPELANAITCVERRESLCPEIEITIDNEQEQRLFSVSCVPVRNRRVLVILNDVTAEKAKQEKFYMTDRLAAIGEMASGVAHELNNPLTSITMLSQMLAKDNISEQDREDLITINSEAKRAASIIKNLLTFARKHAPEKQLGQLNKVLEDVLKLRAYEHKVNNITVETRFDAILPPAKMDYFQMQQVFLNLVLNAEQAMVESHHRGKLTIATEKAGGNIKATVKDDGPGISKENLHRLFTPFFTTKEIGKGTGLGLSISYGIVSSHGGRIYAESELGQGATFTVELPASNN